MYKNKLQHNPINNMTTKKEQRKTTDFEAEIQEMEKVINSILTEYQKLSEEHYLKGLHAHWHLKGLNFHMKNLITNYNIISKEVLARLNKVELVDVLIMHTPEIRNLMYEFYAFINLARITLDNIKYILSPLFITPFNHMPKSITGLASGMTDCPVYERIANTEELHYLIDIRNCIVHYRSFSTSDNSIIIKEGVSIDDPKVENSNWIKPMAKGTFRITENKDVVFNIFIPDVIFDKNNGKKMVEFSYDKRINLLAECMRFNRHLTLNYMEAFSLNIYSQDKRYLYNKSGLEKVKYKMFKL